MNSRTEIWRQLVQPYADGARALAKKVQLGVVCSTQGRTEPVSDYEFQSIDSRFYSLRETEHFLGSLRGAGFLVTPFFNENDFISWVLKGEHLIADGRRLLVIATGASFSGIGCKSLVPAFCRLHGIPVAGPDPHSACLARHKYHSNLVLQALGEVVPAAWCYDPSLGWLNSAPPEGQRVILKLTHEGASIGIDKGSVMLADESLHNKVASLARHYSQAITVQEFIPGLEVEVPVFCTSRPQAVFPVGLSLKDKEPMGDKILTYDLTKADAYGFWDLESYGQEGLSTRVCRLAEKCTGVLGLHDLARIDFRVSSCGLPRVIDISTSPYLSPHSSFAFVASACGASVSDLPLILVGLACARIGLLHHVDEETSPSRFQPDLCVSQQ
jgi:D-alanine-D-alanine ligase